MAIEKIIDTQYEKKYGAAWRLVLKHEGWTEQMFKDEYGTMWEYMKDQDTFARKPKEEQALILSQQAEELSKNSNALATIRAYSNNGQVIESFIKLLGDKNAERYIQSIVIAVSGNPALQKCSPRSIMIAAARAASLGLSVDPALKQAHLVPFGNDVTLIPDYHGLVQMSVATGYYEIPPTVSEVYAGEEVIIDRITQRFVEIIGYRTSNEVTGHIAYFKGKDGTERWLVMTNEECFKHAEVYNPAGYKNPKSAWNKRPEDRIKMCRKTVLRQLVSRWGNFSPIFKQYLFADEPVLDAETFDMPDDSSIVIPEKPIKAHEERRASIEAALEDLGYHKEKEEI